MADQKKETRMAGEELSKYRQSFQDHHDNVVKPRRTTRRQEASDAMGTAYQKDINKYDYASQGVRKFDLKDVEYLRNAGYGDQAIKKYAKGLSADQMSEGLRHNHAKFAGKHATGDMADGAKISDHDVGRGFNIAIFSGSRSGIAPANRASRKAASRRRSCADG